VNPDAEVGASVEGFGSYPPTWRDTESYVLHSQTDRVLLIPIHAYITALEYGLLGASILHPHVIRTKVYYM
jgi:hypothetical protein